MTRIACLVVAVALTLAAVARAPAGRAEERPVRALFVLVGAGGHNVEVNTPPLLKVIERLGGIQVTLLAPPKGKPGDGAHLAKLAEVKRDDYDVLVFYTVGNNLSAEQEKAIQKFVEDGGGLVAIHGASASFGNSKVWLNLVGGRFAGHAPGTHDLQIDIVDRDHPITAGVGPFVVNDEEYTYRFADGVQRHVLARFHERPPGSVEKNGNNDILWTIEAGKGRVFHCGLGHDVKAWGNPNFQKLILQGIYWSAGRPKVVNLPANPEK
jgi:type 1 glutamine amidotransferase